MTHQSKVQQQSTIKTRPSDSEEVKTQKQKAEEREIKGRHKNDGQKDHKGAR
jgi:hypothetical protein